MQQTSPAAPGGEGSGWPITEADLAPFYPEAFSFLGLEAQRFDLPQDGLAAPLDLAQHGLESKLFRLAERGHCREAMRAFFETHPSARVILHANLGEVVLDPSGRTVNSLDVRTLGGNRFSVTARTYVLALGGIETPRLMLASRSVRPGGIGNEHDQVGRSFMDHLVITLGEVDVPSGSHALDLYTSLRDQAVARFWASEALQERLGILQAAIELDPFVPGPIAVASRLITSRVPALGRPMFANQREMAYGRRPNRNNESRLARRLGKTKFRLQHILEQAPNPANRVRLSTGALDPLGLPRAHLEWRATGLEERTGRAIVEAGGRAIAESVGGRFRPGRAAPWPPPTLQGRTGHHMGSTRMGRDPWSSVVNADCRVHSVPNLFVAGSSVFPTSGAGVPTATIVALALRLAQTLLREREPVEVGHSGRDASAGLALE